MTEAVLQRKLMDWFLYDNGLRHERVKHFSLPRYSKKWAA